MIAIALVPLVIGVVAALAAGWISSRVPPAAATVLLTILALTISLATGLILSLAGYVGASELLPLPEFHSWSVDVLRDNVPLPPVVGLIAGATAAILFASAVRHAGRVVSNARQTSAIAAGMPSVDGLSIIDLDAARAYAIPGRHRRIVVSSGMLRSLSGPQRRALLAHEAAHLRCHHHVYVQLARLAAAANPLMMPVSRAVDCCVERWADAAATRAVGDRVTVARAIGAAALASAAAPAGVLGVAHSDVVERVRVLLDPPAHRPQLGMALVVATVLCWVSVVVAVLHTHGVIEVAEAAGR